VTLPTVAAAALAERQATYSQSGPDGPVFTSTEGGLLRRTSATLSIAAGSSTRELMARMGHSSSAAALATST
jgi:hypothetical protein